MNLRKVLLVIWLILTVCIFAYSQAESKGIPKLIVFHSPTCHRCIQAKQELMPQIEEEFKDNIQIEYQDITDMQNYKFLLSLKEKYNAQIKISLPVFFIDGHFLNGESDLKKNLRLLIIQSLNVPVKESKDSGAIDLTAYFKTFRPLAIISAGIIDGINPCAFTVIVFFISFLAVQGYRKRELVAIGLAFITSIFLTYILIGLGLFGFLYRLKGFWLISKIVNISIGIFSIVLGILSLYDFFKFKKTKDTTGLILQLPKLVKDQIHSIIGAHYRSKGKGMAKLVLSAIITGFLISLLEAVCTGQVYLPTITFVLKTSTFKLEALSLLLLYNLMFIIPLLIIFLLALWGVTSEEFAKFLRKHLLTIKVFMAALFFSLGIFLLWRA